MPLSSHHYASSVLLFEYPILVQSSVLLYYKFTRFPHVILDQFVCIAQEDYWRILNHVEKNTHKVEEEGEIVMVKEHRELDRSGTRKGHIVIKVSDFKCLESSFWESILLFWSVQKISVVRQVNPLQIKAGMQDWLGCKHRVKSVW